MFLNFNKLATAAAGKKPEHLIMQLAKKDI